MLEFDDIEYSALSVLDLYVVVRLNLLLHMYNIYVGNKNITTLYLNAFFILAIFTIFLFWKEMVVGNFVFSKQFLQILIFWYICNTQILCWIIFLIFIILLSEQIPIGSMVYRWNQLDTSWQRFLIATYFKTLVWLTKHLIILSC